MPGGAQCEIAPKLEDDIDEVTSSMEDEFEAAPYISDDDNAPGVPIDTGDLFTESDASGDAPASPAGGLARTTGSARARRERRRRAAA